MKHCLIYTTFANQHEAKQIAQQLVENKLAACVNIFPTITSIYRWQDKIEHDQETAALIKTNDTLFNAVEDKIKQLHSYSNCCVIKLPITAGSQQFLDWITAQTTS